MEELERGTQPEHDFFREAMTQHQGDIAQVVPDPVVPEFTIGPDRAQILIIHRIHTIPEEIAGIVRAPVIDLCRKVCLISKHPDKSS